MKKQQFYLVVAFVMLCFSSSLAQKVNDFFYVEKENKELPVLIRGNLEALTILIYVQGGPGETAIDFGRSDYPQWKNTLENKIAIAYYDQRGLNQKIKSIDSSKINLIQYSKDLIKISKVLKEKYKAKIYFMGHSYGGSMVYHCLSENDEAQSIIEGGIIVNTPITTDFSTERYTHFRPLYLKNVAQEFIAKDIDIEKWQEAYDWMKNTDTLKSLENMKIWNAYVDSAFSPTKKKITIGMITKTVFSKPYHPIKYLNRKDNEMVSDLLWKDTRSLNFFERLPNINHPMLLITGRYDDIAGPEEIQKSQELLKNVQTSILPNSGHESFLDQPQLFNETVLKFVLPSN